MTSTRAKAHNKRYLSGPILHRDMAPFYSAIDIIEKARFFAHA
jgi:hypothetical protein